MFIIVCVCFPSLGKGIYFWSPLIDWLIFFSFLSFQSENEYIMPFTLPYSNRLKRGFFGIKFFLFFSLLFLVPFSRLGRGNPIWSTRPFSTFVLTPYTWLVMYLPFLGWLRAIDCLWGGKETEVRYTAAGRAGWLDAVDLFGLVGVYLLLIWTALLERREISFLVDCKYFSLIRGRIPRIDGRADRLKCFVREDKKGGRGGGV